MSSQVANVSDLYTSRKNLLRYLKNQGYNTEAFENVTMAEIQAMNPTSPNELPTTLDFEVFHGEDAERKCSVFYYLKQNQSIKTTLENKVMNYYEENEDKSKNTFIFIMQGVMNDTLQKTIKQLWKKFSEYVVVYEIKHLLFNILKHSYVPKHEKLSLEEKEELSRSKNIKEDSQMPEISVFDPMAKVMLLRPGEVCKITRYNKIAFEDIYYRICVI
jgi:DNA-directed RNA polymerase I, II, and III subunit RPABC1